MRSFRFAFGGDAVYCDYNDPPVNPCCQYHIDPEGCRIRAQQISDSPKIRVIHGHFHPSKYERLENAFRMTFLRHPVENLISIYFFWKTLEPRPSIFYRLMPRRWRGVKQREAKITHGVLEYFHKNQLTILETARLPMLRYLMSQTYFGGVDLPSFDFIGFAESYTRDLQMLSEMLSIPLDEARRNVNLYPNYVQERESLKADRQLMNQLHELLQDDIRLYEHLWNQRERRGSLSRLSA